MKTIRRFFSESYRSDPIAFRLEMVSFLFSVIASGILAATADDPNLSLIYPIFFVGSVSQAIASYRRRAAWVMMVTLYFSMANVFGFCRSIGLL